MRKATKGRRSSAAGHKPVTRAATPAAKARGASAVQLERRVAGLDWKDLAAGLGGPPAAAQAVYQRAT